jgi:hypothetical protein
MLRAHLYSIIMFATFARAITSRGAVALAGATTTAFAFNRSVEHKRSADEVYKKLLQEQGAVTELKQQLQKRDAALNAALHGDQPNACICGASVTEKVREELATALSALAAITSLVGFCMIAAGKGMA